MKALEEIVADKILDMVHYMLSKAIKPDITIDKVTELDVEKIKELKQEYGIKGIILDVDDTLRKEMNSIPKANQEWIDIIKDELKIVILSNGIDKGLESFFKERGINYISFAHKPLRKNFLKACEEMNIQPDEVLVIGDSLFDDIYGGKRNKMKTILVKNVEDEER